MAVWSTQSKNLGGYGYILMEDGSFLLQETSDKIILEQTSAAGVVWSSQSKS